jgi:hypothetical protein
MSGVKYHLPFRMAVRAFGIVVRVCFVPCRVIGIRFRHHTNKSDTTRFLAIRVIEQTLITWTHAAQVAARDMIADTVPAGGLLWTTRQIIDREPHVVAILDTRFALALHDPMAIRTIQHRWCRECASRVGD